MEETAGPERSAPAVRAAQIGDMEAVAEVYAHYVAHSVATFDTEPRSADTWRALWKDSRDAGRPFLVAELDGAVAGYAMVGPWKPKPAYRQTAEDSIYLAPSATGRGAGRALLEGLLSAAEEAGLREVVAVIADTPEHGQGAASRALHARAGFTEIGRMPRVGRKHGMWVDTVLMQRSLGDAGAAGP